jgi:hypothetical protein
MKNLSQTPSTIPIMSNVMDFLPHFVDFLLSSPAVEDFDSPNDTIPANFTRIQKYKMIESMVFGLVSIKQNWGGETWIDDELAKLDESKKSLEASMRNNELALLKLLTDEGILGINHKMPWMRGVNIENAFPRTDLGKD